MRRSPEFDASRMAKNTPTFAMQVRALNLVGVY